MTSLKIGQNLENLKISDLTHAFIIQTERKGQKRVSDVPKSSS